MSVKPSMIVVGIDGTAAAVDAARWAGSVAQALGCSLRLVHSMATAPHSIADASVIAIRAAATEAQRSVAEKILGVAEEVVHAALPSVDVVDEVVADPIDKVLVKYSHDARLIVLGCGDVTPAAALLIGSTTLTVATHAACPVVAWRGQPTANATAPIVVGVDDSDAGIEALVTAFEIADALQVPLRAVRAWSLPPTIDGATIALLIDSPTLQAGELGRLEELVEHHGRRYPDVSVQCLVEEAKAGHALLEHADGAQLLIVGSRGRNRLASVVLGSTGLNLLHHSHIPVMICHRSDSR